MAPDLVSAERAALNGGVLPADVIYEILLRVPAKALCRLRLVCRSWRSLTSDPRFAREHLPRHPLFAARHPFWEQIHIVDMSGKIVKQIRSFEGFGFFKLSVQADLICVAESETKRARLLNPATGEITALPDASLDILESRCILGRVPSTGEYKVIRIGFNTYYNNGRPCECEVITLGGGGGNQKRVMWKWNPPIQVSPYFSRVAAIDGVAYFLPAHGNGIAMFDFVTEEWRSAALQGPLGTDCASSKLVKLSGCLVMADHNYRDCSLDLWFLVDVDRGLWNKRYSMQYSHWRQEAPYPLVILDDGKVVTWVGFPRILKTYDPRTGTWDDHAKLEDYHSVGMLEGSLLCSALQN